MWPGKEAPLTFAHTATAPFMHQHMSKISVLPKVVALYFCDLSLFKYVTFKMTWKWEPSFCMWKMLWKNFNTIFCVIYPYLCSKMILDQQIIEKWGSSLKASSPFSPAKTKLMGEKRYIWKVWSSQRGIIWLWDRWCSSIKQLNDLPSS